MSKIFDTFPQTVESYEGLSEAARGVLSEEDFAEAYTQTESGGYEINLTTISEHSAFQVDPPKEKEPGEPKQAQQTTPPKDAPKKAATENPESQPPENPTTVDFESFNKTLAKVTAAVTALGDRLDKTEASQRGFTAANLSREVGEALDGIKDTMIPTAFELIKGQNIGKGAVNQWSFSEEGVPVVKNPHGLDQVKGASEGLTLDQYMAALTQYPNQLFKQSGERNGATITMKPGLTKAELEKTPGAKARFLRENDSEVFLNLPDN